MQKLEGGWMFEKFWNFLLNRRLIVNSIFFSLSILFLSFLIISKINYSTVVKEEKSYFENISKITWKFGRADGSVIAQRIKFLPNKKLKGYSSANEMSWGIKDNKYLIFYNANFKETTVFTFSKKENNKWFLSGAFLFDDTITHTLEEIQRDDSYNEKIFFLLMIIILLILFFYNFNMIKKGFKLFLTFLENQNNFKIFGIVSLLFGIIFSLSIIIKTPPTMDEFLPYHQFARFFFPGSKEHKFREPANDSFDITIFGLKLPLRSYPYVGYSESLRYLPFYILSRSYISSRIMKFILILLLLFSLWKLTKIPFHFASILLLFNLPIIFQMIIDTGPVAYQLMISLLIPLIIKSTKNIFLSILSGILIYFAFELKTIFFYLSFPIALISFSLIIKDFVNESLKEKIKRIIFILVIVISFLIPTLLTITGKTKYGRPYYKELTENRHSTPLFDYEEQCKHYQESFKIYFDSFMNFGHRVYGTFKEGKILTLLIFLIFLAIFLLLVFIYIFQKEINKYIFFKKNDFFHHKLHYNKMDIIRYKYKKFLNENLKKKYSYEFIISIISLLCFIFVFININRMPDSWAGHHIILSFPFLILSIAFAVKIVYAVLPKPTIILLLFLMVFSSILLTNLLSKNPLPTDDRSKIKILNYLNNKKIAKENIYVVIDWGIYYISSIYGPSEQIVLYIDPLNSISQMIDIEKIAQRKRRNITFILRKYAGSNIDFIEEYFKNVNQIENSNLNESDLWQLWQKKYY